MHQGSVRGGANRASGGLVTDIEAQPGALPVERLQAQIAEKGRLKARMPRRPPLYGNHDPPTE